MVCQEDCEFSDYNSTSQKAKCLCQVKESSSSFADININKTKLLENLGNIKSFLNINYLSCYQTLFIGMSIIHNIGFYVVTFILIFHIINILLFFINQFRQIEKKIKDIIFAIEKLKLKKPNKRNKNETKIKGQDKIAEDNKMQIINNKMISRKNKKPKIEKKMKKSKYKHKLKRKNFNSININNNLNSNMIYNKNNILTQGIRSKRGINSNTKKQKFIEKATIIMEYTEDEINMLPYELALLYDKRKFWGYYISLLKTKHNLIFSFFNTKDYNSQIAKIDLFIIRFAIYYTVNALFFDDNTMHKIYENEGKFDIEYQLPKIIFSSLISMVLNTLLKLLAISNTGIIDFKKNTKKEEAKRKGKFLKKLLRIKFILYFIISTIFLLFFWYYISMFGAIYRNTQLHLLKDTLMSFALSLIYPFGIYLLPGIFRIPALSAPKKNRKFLYNFSKILQIF